MTFTILGLVFVIWGVFTLAMGIRYLHGRGPRHTPYGPPVAGIGAGPSLLFVGLAISLPDRGIVSALARASLVLALLSMALLVTLAIVHFVSGWPRYGQWPNLLRVHRQRPVRDQQPTPR